MGWMFWVGAAIGFYIVSGFVSRALKIDVLKSTPKVWRAKRLGR